MNARYRPAITKVLFLILTIFLGVPAMAGDPISLSEVLMRSTFKIKGPTTSGTVVILGQPDPKDSNRAFFVLVTAGHVLTEISSDIATLSLRIKKGPGLERVEFPIQIRASGKPLWVQHPKADVAAMRVAIPNETDIRLISTDLLATDQTLQDFEVGPGDELFVFGYPLGVEGHPLGYPVLRSGRVSSFPLVPVASTTTFLLDFEVFPGNSGGPVILHSENRFYKGSCHIGKVILFMGVVSQELKMEEKVQGLDVTKIKAHRLALAVIVHAQFVKELLALLPPAK